ncbi:MAG: hypothetical protein R3335_12765, partial [Anaerolineales bacterium]|nr:hypothetical protein [Anaerolineales bacterium]
DGWQLVLAARREEQAAAVQEDISGKVNTLDLVAVLPEDLAEHLKSCTLIVNATPVGMHPNVEQTPWPEGVDFPSSAAVYDMVYNPLETQLVRDARAAGLQARTGIGMLVEQAALAFEAWTGLSPSRSDMMAAINLQDG